MSAKSCTYNQTRIYISILCANKNLGIMKIKRIIVTIIVIHPHRFKKHIFLYVKNVLNGVTHLVTAPTEDLLVKYHGDESVVSALVKSKERYKFNL